MKTSLRTHFHNLRRSFVMFSAVYDYSLEHGTYQFDVPLFQVNFPVGTFENILGSFRERPKVFHVRQDAALVSPVDFGVEDRLLLHLHELVEGSFGLDQRGGKSHRQKRSCVLGWHHMLRQTHEDVHAPTAKIYRYVFNFQMKLKKLREFKTYKLSIFSKNDIKPFSSDSKDGKIAPMVALTCSLTWRSNFDSSLRLFELGLVTTLLWASSPALLPLLTLPDSSFIR